MLNHWTNPIAKSWHSWEAGLLLPKSQKPNEGEVVAAGPGEVWWLRQRGSKLEELDVGGLQGAVIYKATLFFVSWNLVEPDLIGIRYENRRCQRGFHQNLAFKVGNVPQVTLHPWRPMPNLASWCPCLWRLVKRPGWQIFSIFLRYDKPFMECSLQYFMSGSILFQFWFPQTSNRQFQ